MAESAAKALQLRLSRPTLLKRMIKSYVSGGYSLGGFSEWSKGVLPDANTDMALEFRMEHWPVRWIYEKTAFSGGWRRFASDQKLAEGDYVLFEKKDERVIKAFIFRDADYQQQGTPDEDPCFEDAEVTDFKGRKLPAPAGTNEGKAPPKRSLGADNLAGRAKKQSIDAVDAGAGPSSRAAPGEDDEEGASEDSDDSGEVKAAGRGGRRASGAGAAADELKRRNPRRQSHPDGAVHQLKVLQEMQARSFAPKRTTVVKKPKAEGKAAVKKQRAVRDPNAPKKAPAPRKPKDLNARVRAPRAPAKKRPKKVSVFDYVYPAGKASEMAEILKARHREVCGDAIRVDKKTGDILDGHREGLLVRGYRSCYWQRVEGSYRPIHVILS